MMGWVGPLWVLCTSLAAFQWATGEGTPEAPHVREAEVAYQQGLECLGRYDLVGPQESVGHFLRAIEIDSTHAGAYAGLAQAYFNLLETGMLSRDEAVPKMKSAALRAVELDETSVDARLSLHNVYLDEWRFAEAERELEFALRMGPDVARAHDMHAMYLLDIGRFDEAMKASRRYTALDSTSGYSRWHFSYCCYRAGRCDEAIKMLEGVEEEEPITLVLLVWLYGMKGMYEKAFHLYDQVISVLPVSSEPSLVATKGWLQGLSGQEQEAMQSLKQLEELSADRFVDPYNMALVCLGLGDHGAALGWLERAIGQHAPSALRLKSTPMLRPLYGDPRFEDLLQTVEFP